MASIKKGDTLTNRSLVGTIEPKDGKNGKYYIVTAQLDLRDARNRECTDKDGNPAIQTNPYLDSSKFTPKGSTQERVGHGVIYTQQQVDAMLAGFQTRVNPDTRKIEFAGKADLFYKTKEERSAERAASGQYGGGRDVVGMVIQTKPETSQGRKTNMPSASDFKLDSSTLANQAKMRKELIEARKGDVAKGLQSIIDNAKSGKPPVGPKAPEATEEAPKKGGRKPKAETRQKPFGDNEGPSETSPEAGDSTPKGPGE